MFLQLLVLLMTTQLFAKIDQWEKFNSSLLIEVTRPNGVFTCTGVAVAPKVVITAAHCLAGEIKKVRVFTQEKYDPKLPSFESSGFELHPGYMPAKSAYINDIAKITLKEALPTAINIHPVFKEKYLLGTIYRFGFGQRRFVVEHRAHAPRRDAGAAAGRLGGGAPARPRCHRRDRARRSCRGRSARSCAAAPRRPSLPCG